MSSVCYTLFNVFSVSSGYFPVFSVFSVCYTLFSVFAAQCWVCSVANVSVDLSGRCLQGALLAKCKVSLHNFTLSMSHCTTALCQSLTAQLHSVNASLHNCTVSLLSDCTTSLVYLTLLKDTGFTATAPAPFTCSLFSLHIAQLCTSLQFSFIHTLQVEYFDWPVFSLQFPVVEHFLHNNAPVPGPGRRGGLCWKCGQIWKYKVHKLEIVK